MAHQPPSISMPHNLPGWPLDLALTRYSANHHGDFPQWMAALQQLPSLAVSSVNYGDTVAIHGKPNQSEPNRNKTDNSDLEQTLQEFHPWRKGPFQINDVFIDTEWRSDWKWNRIKDTLGSLDNQRILDIGCGNGYFGWRMLEAGAAEIIGIDPTLLFCMQHLAISHLCRDQRNWVLPLKIEEIPTTVRFDTTLSMGVIYHRRDPMQHARELFGLTQDGGLGVLESIVTRGESALIPTDRYARMRNVWCIPRVEDLTHWMHIAGFQDIQVVDVSTTTTGEQRSTQWMRFESLRDCLDPDDVSQTVEGYAAPVRATVVGTRPQ